jgi:hypothetical protein
MSTVCIPLYCTDYAQKLCLRQVFMMSGMILATNGSSLFDKRMSGQ